MLQPKLLLFLAFVSLPLVESCQPELVENAVDLITVGYDRLGSTALYVDTLSLEMKNKKKFTSLLTPECNKRRDASIAVELREEGGDWAEHAKEIRITSRQYDDIKTLDPCKKYEIKILIKPLKGQGDIRELPLFSVGPYYELDTESTRIAKFKGDGENYYKEHFNASYSKVTHNSFTIEWQPICAMGINIFVRDEEEDDWERASNKFLQNDIQSPTTEVTFDVEHCKVYEVTFEFKIDSASDDEIFTSEIEIEKVTTDPNKEIIQAMLMKHSYDNSSNTIEWDYTSVLDEFYCLDSFSYTLKKDENGDIEDLMSGNQDSKPGKFNIGTITSNCNYGIRMEVEYETVEKHKQKIDAFEEHIHKENQVDNAIVLNGSKIFYQVNPCVEPNSEIVIGLSEVGTTGREAHGRALMSDLTATVSVEKENAEIESSALNETDLKSCVAYKIILLRRSGQDLKELETAEFDNPKWITWKSPTISGKAKTDTSITLEMTDNETNNTCQVRHYNISCTNVDNSNVKEATFQSNEDLKLDNLNPETSYNCTGRIIHSIPGSGEFSTPFADYVVLETTAAPVKETNTDDEEENDDEDATANVGQKVVDVEEDTKDNQDNAGSPVIPIVVVILLVALCLGGFVLWKKKRGSQPKDPEADNDANLSYRASTTAGTKSVEMDSSVLTDTEDEKEKENNTAKNGDNVITDVKEADVQKESQKNVNDEVVESSKAGEGGTDNTTAEVHLESQTESVEGTKPSEGKSAVEQTDDSTKVEQK